MEQKREEQLIRDDTGKYQDPHLDNEFMAAMSEVYMALQEAGYDPFDQLTGYVRTGNDQYITRHHNARKTVTDASIRSMHWKAISKTLTMLLIGSTSKSRIRCNPSIRMWMRS